MKKNVDTRSNWDRRRITTVHVILLASLCSLSAPLPLSLSLCISRSNVHAQERRICILPWFVHRARLHLHVRDRKHKMPLYLLIRGS